MTNVEVAKLAVNSTVETAYGNGNKTYYEALAENSTIGEVTTAQALGYEEMKYNFTNFTDHPVQNFGTDNILMYLKNSLIKDYDEGKIAISLDL